MLEKKQACYLRAYAAVIGHTFNGATCGRVIRLQCYLRARVPLFNLVLPAGAHNESCASYGRTLGYWCYLRAHTMKVVLPMGAQFFIGATCGRTQ